MTVDNPTLSICIPTYNRVQYLERLINSLILEAELLNGRVEIVISDNASSDHTYEFVQQLMQRHAFIHYHRNDVNLGADGNIHSVFAKARGRFAWVIGDDDYLQGGSLTNIYDFLVMNSLVDLIYVESKPHKEKINERADNIDFVKIENKEILSKNVGVFFTFISGIIINKLKHKTPSQCIEKYAKSNLVQLSWVYDALKHGDNFIIIKNQYVISQPDNTGGYKLFTVFAKNLTSITEDFFGKNSPVAQNIQNSAMYLLLHFIRSGSDRFENENYLKICDDAFGNNAKYIYIYRQLYKYSYLRRWFFRTLDLLKKILKK